MARCASREREPTRATPSRLWAFRKFGMKGRKALVWDRCVILLLCLVILGHSAVGYADEERGNPAARLLSGDSASEHWEFTARFDSGHLLFVEFLITNIGLGERNAAAVWHLVTPEGKTHRTTNGRREGNWTLSADHLRMEIGSSML